MKFGNVERQTRFIVFIQNVRQYYLNDKHILCNNYNITLYPDN